MSYMPMQRLAVWDGPMMRSPADVDEAVNFLMLKWPKPFAETELHIAARVTALSVLEGHETVQALHLALRAAAQEADILAGSHQPNAGSSRPPEKGP